MNQNYLNLIRLYQSQNPNNSKNLKYYVAIDGLSKGNMDATLIMILLETMFQENLMKNNPLNLLRAYQFALIDLQLYLDTHPNDVVTKELFDKYLDEYNQAKKLYEEKCGPLTLDSEANKGKVWKWQKGWPFEGMGK
ncbi:MAG: spore coat protein CotJB [Christensenellales bacterium]